MAVGAAVASVLVTGNVASTAVASSSRESPLKKVVSLLTEMKAQVEKEAAEDEENHEKQKCWCESNEKKKDAAVKAAEEKITELEAVIDEAAGLKGQLQTEIGQLETGIKEDQESLATATTVREKEASAAAAEAADAKECIEALTKALEVLSKVQLLEKPADAAPLLAQLKEAVQVVHSKQQQPGKFGLPRFQGIMQQDLWDVLGSIENAAADVGIFLPPAPRRSLSVLGQSSRVRGARRALQPEGAAAGAVSYNSRSGSIVGILSTLKDDFVANLKSNEKAEMDALVAYQELRSSKEAEITTGISQKKLKEKALAETNQEAANAKADVEATKDALTADQKFLVELTKTCTEAKDTYAERSKSRTEEILALGETLRILSEDETRDLVSKTLTSFLQMTSVDSKATAASKAADAAMQRIIKIARKHKNWVLASLAVRVRLDGFEQVKEAMDKMVAELKKQQQVESEKLDMCKKEIDETEDNIKVKGNAKEDLEALKLKLEGTLGTLESEIETLQSEVADLQVSLKNAGEQRKSENALFRQSISDQRGMINILNKAVDRLKAFYLSKPGFLQTVHTLSQEPNKTMPASKGYEKSGGAGGVIQVMEKIITDASSAEAAMIKEEQYAQRDYETLVKSASSSIDSNNVAITEKTKLAEEAKADISTNAGSLLENGEETSKLQDMLKGMHLDCDFLLKYYDARQKARAEEMDAIAEAKAILSGATFD
jgi:hypothetical protein